MSSNQKVNEIAYTFEFIVFPKFKNKGNNQHIYIEY